MARQRLVMVVVVYGLAVLALAGFGLALFKSQASPKHLLITAVIWLAVVLAWGKLSFEFGWSYGNLDRTLAITVSYAFIFVYQIFLYGWLIPLAIGLFRLATG